MNRKIGIVFLAALAFSLLAGCAGTVGNLLSNLDPFVGNYTGTLTYTSGPTDEAMTMSVNTSGHVQGTFSDPVLGAGTLAGQLSDTGTVTGTTLNGVTPGTFTFSLTSVTSTHFTGTGTFTVSSTAKPVTLDLTKS